MAYYKQSQRSSQLSCSYGLLDPCTPRNRLGWRRACEKSTEERKLVEKTMCDIRTKQIWTVALHTTLDLAEANLTKRFRRCESWVSRFESMWRLYSEWVRGPELTMWNTQQTSEKSLSTWWQRRTKETMNNYGWNVFRERSVALTFEGRVATQNSVLFLLLWRQRLNTFLQPHTSNAGYWKHPGVSRIRYSQMYVDGQSARWGRMQRCCSRVALETASKQRAFSLNHSRLCPTVRI